MQRDMVNLEVRSSQGSLGAVGPATAMLTSAEMKDIIRQSKNRDMQGYRKSLQSAVHRRADRATISGRFFQSRAA